MSREADQLDVAADLSRALAEAGVDEVRRRAKPEQVQGADGNWPISECVDCDTPLGVRASLGKIRCIDCQSILERRSRAWPR